MWLAGTVPFDSECSRYGQYVVHAGFYDERTNDNDPALKEKVRKFHESFLCPECDQYRRRVGQTREQFLREMVG